ncbi:tetratricopeptide repeat protein [Sporosarcina sp. NPDC096371]|uniref:tetratricopeptide repeat protein n=1 Tax=Sporosarcina sp. NPDC096371 TaxID=3364530 RepID=UPI00382EEC33
MHVGKRLKELRNSKNMTQATVSHDITSTPHYSNIEGGHFATSQEILVLLAKRLSVPSGYLTNGYVIDKKMTVLLAQYEDILNADRLEDALSLREKHEKCLTHIQSLHQELYFRLLRCLEFFKAEDFGSFKQYYMNKIAPSVDQDALHNLNTRIREKYNYISGLYYYITSNYQGCIPFFIHVLKTNEDTLLQARLNFNVALAYFRLYRYAEALVFAEKSKSLHLNSHNWEKTAECYNLMAILHRTTKDYEAAEMYIQKGFNILEHDVTKRTYLILLHNLTLIHRDKGDYHQALVVIDNCIVLKKEHNLGNLFMSYWVRLELLLELKAYDEVQSNIELTRSACHSEEDKINLQVTEGKVYYLQGRYADYEKLTQLSIDYYFKHEHWKYLQELAKEFAEYYAQKKQYKKAYELHKLCLHATKSIYGEL